MSTINGAIITDFGSYDTGNYVFTQADGKITVMGITSGTTSDDLAIARYNADGSLDTTFDGDGKLIATATMTINAVRPLSDGKFLTVGGDSSGNSALARYNSNGSLDTSAAVGLGAEDAFYSVVIQADSRILLVGGSSNNYAVAARYDSDGKLDTSFSGNGQYTPYNGDSWQLHAATAVTVQPDGKSIVAGRYDNDFAVARLDRNGNLDISFDGDGQLRTDLGGTDIIKTVTVLGSGKILAAGTSNGDFALVRYNANGSLDTSFDTDGKLVTDLGGTETLNSLVALADGKFLAAGTDGNNDMVLMRFNSDGSFDTGFDTDGKVTTDLGGWETGNSVAVQSDGKILLAGTTDTDFALVRYNTDGSLDTSFNGSTPSPTNHSPTGNVTISDTTPTENQTLTAGNTLVDTDKLGAITYTWKTGETTLGTGTTYTVTTADIGKTLSVTASYTDGGGTKEAVSSAATAAVAKQGTVDPGTGTPGFNVDSGGDFTTSEAGDTAVFNVKLNTAPTRDVSVTFTSSDTTEGVISNPTLKFTSANWSIPQTFTVTGQNDNEVDGDVPYSISAKVTTIDVIYKNIAVAGLTLTNQDTPVANVETINGGDGIDILQGSAAPSYVLGKAGDDDLSGGAGNDTIYGSYGSDVLFGEDDNDVLYGEQDADYLEGGNGNDTLDGGLGVDTLIGGAGNDTYYLGYDAADVIDDQGAPTDVDVVIMPYQLSKYTLPAGIEQGTIAAGTGASSLTGNTGNNALTGNDGNNMLNGAVGRDSLFGGVGNDVLVGGTGNDTLSGGAGKDFFKFNAALKANTDKITDFIVVDDTIQLENSIFTKLKVTGVLSAGNFVKAATAQDSNDYILYNSATGAVSYDADGSGSGVAVQVALLGVDLSLTFADFVVI